MLNVLVVDDSMIMRKNVKKIMDELGHHVTGEAANGEDAIFLASEFLPQLVTMDITMPGMGGIEATKILKKKYPDLKIVMITSHGQENLVRDAIKNGAKGFILKPITQEKIEEIISKLFKNSKRKNKELLLDEEIPEELNNRFQGLV